MQRRAAAVADRGVGGAGRRANWTGGSPGRCRPRLLARKPRAAHATAQGSRGPFSETAAHDGRVGRDGAGSKGGDACGRRPRPAVPITRRFVRERGGPYPRTRDRPSEPPGLAGARHQGPQGRRPRHAGVGDPRGHRRPAALHRRRPRRRSSTSTRIPGAAPFVRGRPRHDVHGPAVDDPPVRRLLHRRGVERLLPAQPGRRPAGRVGGLRPRHPPRATTPTTRAWSATSARRAWRSTRSRT